MRGVRLKVAVLAFVAMLAVGCSTTASTPALKPSSGPSLSPSPSPSLSPRPLPHPVCTTSTEQGSCGPYHDPRVNGPNDPTVGNNIWNPIAGARQTLYVNSPGAWYVTSNMPTGNTDVVSYPSLGNDFHVQNSSGNWIAQPLTNFASVISSFSETMNATASTDAWASYDIWMDNGDEVMIQHDFSPHANPECPHVATATFGGSFGVPVQAWGLCTYGTELIWQLPASTSEQSGSVDILAMLTWLEQHGYVPRNEPLASIDYGWEICSTGGVNENFQVSDFSITTRPAGSGQPPAATTNGATSVAATSATLNGSVNRDGQATTYQFDYGTTTGYGSSVPSQAVASGSGTSAVTESANLTGLRPGTTYHYRIKATNATGSAYGSDQTFTTPVNASGNVAYEATAPSGSGAKCARCATLNWNHTVSGSFPAVLAGVAVGAADDSGLGVSVTDNGRPMTLLKTVHTDNNTAGFLDVFGLLNAPAGTNTISVSVSGGTAVEITGGSESLGNVAQWGYIASAYGNNGTASVTSPGSTSGGIMAGFTACGSGVTSAAGPAASRYIVNEDQNTGAGNSAGATSPSTGGPVTMAWSVEDDYWGAIVVEAQPGSSG